MTSLKLNRRTLLRGIGGAAIGLPVLECMLDKKAEAQALTPKRYGIVFAGQSIGGDGWAKDSQRINGRTFTETGHFIAPLSFGRGYALTTPLQPLMALQNDFSIVSNFAIPFSATSTDGADVPPGGAFRDFHGGGASPLLSGVRSTEARFTAEGITSDQVIAGLNQGQTNINSLVYRAQPSWYLSGSDFSGREYMSYTAARRPIAAQTSPSVAFGSLFQGFTPSGTAERERYLFNQRAKISVLDLIGRKRQRLTSNVGAADKARLDRHFDELRDLERRIQAMPPMMTGACQILPDPGMDPAIGGNNAGSGSTDIGTNTGYSEEDTRAKLFADMIHMAMVCDLSRVATLQVTCFQSHMNVFNVSTMMGLPIRADQHEVGHNGDDNNRGQQAVSTILKWHVSIYGYLLQKLKDTPELGGNMLDNTVLVFMPEGGHGLQLNDGATANQTHSVENMVLLVGGKAGGLKPGQHIDGGRRHPGTGLISAMRAAGYTGDTFGEVSGHIDALFT
ncbi:MAG: DUF1552 domain-containing protein [Myxococcota bacterium]